MIKDLFTPTLFNNCIYKTVAAVENNRMYDHPNLRYEGVSRNSRLAAWSENCKWYSCLPLGAVVSLTSESG